MTGQKYIHRLQDHRPIFPDASDTARLVLRPLAATDGGAIVEAYTQDPEVTCYLIWCPHRSIAEPRDCFIYGRTR